MKKSLRKTVKTWSTPPQEEERVLVPCVICGEKEFIAHFPSNGTNSLFAPLGNLAVPVFFNYVRCIRCGLVQINPQPSLEAVALRYNSNNAYLDYEKANEEKFLQLQQLALHDAGFYEREQELFQAKDRHLDANPPSVLDIGSATGALLLTLKNRGWSAKGVEISVPQAEYSRKLGLDVKSLPLKENHFPSQSFDAVLASHVIEHLNDPFDFACEALRLLKPGGHFYVTTPNIKGFQAVFFGGRWRSAIFDHLYLFSGKTLCMLLEKAGFLVEQKKTWGGLAAGAAPPLLKRIFDKLAKPFGFGDVMIIRAAARGQFQ